MFSQLPETEWTVEKAAHLLNRAAFGGPPEDIINLYNMGLEKAVDAILTSNQEKDNLDLFPTTGGNIDEIAPTWLYEMQAQQYCYRDKLALFWHTNLPAARFGSDSWAYTTLYGYVTKIRNLNLQCYSDIIKAISKDWLMASYLDIHKNTKHQRNENFARELLELFTLGEGNYTEEDIKDTAAAFTGYQGNVFKANLHDTNVKTILNTTKNFNGDEVIDLLCATNACASRLANKLWKYYTSTDLTKEQLNFLSSYFNNINLNIKTFLRKIFLSKEFYSLEIIKKQIKSPVVLLINAFKTTKCTMSLRDKKNYGFLQKWFFEPSGQVLFYPPSVKGWPEGKMWITSGSLLSRYGICSFIAKTLTDDEITNILPLNITSKKASDLLCARLLNTSPTYELEQNIVDFINRTDYSNINVRRELIKLVMCTPAYQLI